MPSQEEINNNWGVCEMCERETVLTFHHLIPRTLHKRKWYQKRYTSEELNQGIDICYSCHEAVHDFITEKDLGKHYNTLDLLMKHPKVDKFVEWISKRDGRFKSHRANAR